MPTLTDSQSAQDVPGKVREWTKNSSIGILMSYRNAFTSYLEVGVMPFSPPIAGLFAEVYDPEQSSEANWYRIEAARDTLSEMIEGGSK